MEKIYFQMNKLILDDEVVEFSKPIKEIKVYKDLVLVLLRIAQGEINNQNVYAVNTSSKKIVWRIQEPEFIYEDSPYINIIDCSNGIIIGNWNGISYQISEIDGRVIKRKLTK
jgi:hypothetical protein